MPPAQAARFADDIVAGRLTALACVDAEETAAATELRAAETGLPVWSVTFWPRFSDDGEPRRPFYRELAAPTADAARAEAEAWADDSEVTDVEATL